MTHRTSPRFWASFSDFQNPSNRNFSLFKTNPTHPSLHFKKVGKLWSVRAGPHHRALAVEHGTDFIWVWIGPHDEGKRLIKQQG